MRIDDFYTASALGVGNEETWANCRAGEAPGMREIEGDIPHRRIWFGCVPDASLPPAPHLDAPACDTRACRLLDRAAEALSASVQRAAAAFGAARIGVVLGASNTGVDEAGRLVDDWLDSATRPAAMDLALLELGTPARYLRRRLGLEGPAYTVSTACSSATKAFGAAARLLARGVCDAVVTGGVDGRCRFAMNGFHALGALSASRCRPLAPDRDGITLGEGVALFLVTRDREGGGERGGGVPAAAGHGANQASFEFTRGGGVPAAAGHGANQVPFEFPRGGGVPAAAGHDGALLIRGIGESSDAYHATAPDPEGCGAEAAMRAALADARMEPGEIDYVNLHGTGTPANDAMEMKALRRVWPDVTPAFESTKRLTGHCLGAAGAVEAAICALRLRAGAAHAALSNSFAFGGSNASVILSA